LKVHLHTHRGVAV